MTDKTTANNHHHSDSGRRKGLSGLMLGLIIAVMFLVWGLFIFITIGDKGPPPWDFGTVEDIPGESPYSTNRF